MRTVVYSFCLLLSFTVVTGQSSYNTALETPVPLFRTVDLRTVEQSHAFVSYREQPKPGGDAYHAMLSEQKARASQRFPEKQQTTVRRRSAVDPPILIRSFSGNGFLGIPLDNHLAVNRQDQVVSVVNHWTPSGPNSARVNSILTLV